MPADWLAAVPLEEEPGSDPLDLDVDEPSVAPTLADRWQEGLEGFLDPDPPLLRLSAAGMGPEIDRQLGGGLSPGQTLALASMGAGVGKTSLLHQTADGIAEANAQEHVRALERGRPPVLVPVVFVSEMTVRDLTLRSLARQAGVEGYFLRDPKGERGSRPLMGGVTYGEDALQRAAIAAELFQEAARFITPLDRRTRVTVPDLQRIVAGVRERWDAEGAQVPAVAVFVDPIHRIVDPARAEVEALGEGVTRLMDLAHREDAIVLFSSDTTKVAASARGEAGSLKRGTDLAASVEMAFRGSYQLLHLPDVALGLVTLAADDENLQAEDRARLASEPPGTMYAEVINAKARWDKRGRRAAYFLDPAMFRFRPTTSRALPRELPLIDRICAYVATDPGCSENRVRRNVTGRTEDIRSAIQEALRDGRIRDEGTAGTGRKLHPGRNPHGTRAEQGGNNLGNRSEGPGAVPGGSPYRGEPPRGTTSDPAPELGL